MSSRGCCHICGKYYDDGCNRSCEEIADLEDKIDGMQREAMTDKLSALLARIEDVVGKASLGPWEHYEDGFYPSWDVSIKGSPFIVCEGSSENNAHFIVLMRSVILPLVRVAEEYKLMHDNLIQPPLLYSDENHQAWLRVYLESALSGVDRALAKLAEVDCP